MKSKKMLITLSLANNDEITRAVISTIDPESLKKIIVEMHDQLVNPGGIPTF